jgi:hypothetical protein
MGVKDTANLAMIPAAYAEDKVYSVLPSDGDGDFTFTRTGSGTRINKGGYIETMAENVPRLNYRLDADGNPKGCPELLLEESRQNKVFPNNSLTGYSTIGVSTTNNDTIAPNGTNEGAKVQATTSGTAVVFKGFTGTSGVTHNISAFVKAGTYNQVRLQEGFSASNIDVNLSNGNIVANSNSSNLNVEKYPNDWYRVSFDFTSSSTNLQFALYFNGSYSSGENIYLYGGQIEQGSGATSLINTTSGAITRNKDSAYNQPFGDLASDYPITVYWKGTVDAISTNQTIFSIYKNGSAVDYLRFSWANASFVQVERRRTTQDVDSQTYSVIVGEVKKVAIKFTSATSYKLYIDGIEVRNESSGTNLSWDFNSVVIGTTRIVSDTGFRNTCDELFVWNKALTDAEMVDVTSYDTFAEMANNQQYTIQ